jgi:hypothetical protein
VDESSIDPSVRPVSCVSVSEADLRELIDESPADGAVGVGHSGGGWAVKISDGYLVAARIVAPGVDEWGVWLAGGVEPLAGPVRSVTVDAEVMTAWPRIRDIDAGPVESCLP